MHYEINVALNGKHFFATHARSARTLSDAEAIFDELDKRFPASEGFSLHVTEHRSTSTMIAFR